MKKITEIVEGFTEWRIKHLSTNQFYIILSIVTGIVAALVASLLKWSVHGINYLLNIDNWKEFHDYYFFAYPLIGIALSMIFVKYILRKNISQGIPRVLFSISKEGAIIKPHNMYSSVITSALTVGFGGSAGLEGPTVVTGAAIGSNIGNMLGLNFKQRLLMLGCATAAAVAAIFKAPITGLVFVLEVFMLDLTMTSLVPLLVSSLTGVLVSYAFMGSSPVYFFRLTDFFSINDLPYYIVLGIVCAISSIYFTRCFIGISKLFKKIKNGWIKLLIGCSALALMMFFFPSLYGEGYDAINSCLNGDFTYLFDRGFFISGGSQNYITVIVLLAAIIVVKAVATSTTFAAGGVGGIFAPSLFVGANTGLLFAIVVNHLNLGNLSPQNFALVGMAGTMAGVLHAPLTAVFLIAELTGGYKLFVPLLIVSVISYVVTKKFITNSIYTYQLAQRNELLTHHNDKNVLSLMKVDKLIETNFSTVFPDDTLRTLVHAVEETSRNIFAVIDPQTKYFYGIIKLDSIRTIMFHPELYDQIYVKDLMIKPKYTVRLDESMESVATKFANSEKFNIAVLDENNIYQGFVSRAKIFSMYRRMSKQLSDN